QVVVAEMPEDAKPAAVAAAKPAVNPSVNIASLGLKLAAITDDLRQKYKLDDKQKGIIVTDVSATGIAADRGLKPGDVIVEVQQQTVAAPGDLQKRISEAKGQGRK